MTGTSTAAITEPSSTFVAFVLRQLDCARLRTSIVLNEIDIIGVALKGGLIDGEGALACLAECGLLDFVTGASS
jgi:hypothetical protein